MNKTILTILAVAAACLLIIVNFRTMTNNTKATTETKEVDIDGLTFELSDNVTVERVVYKNRYGIEIAGDMYLSKDFDKSEKHRALIIGTPYGGVKEQGAGIYAQNMAERGFVAITFDESYNGDSGGVGSFKDVSSPEIFVEDFSAGVDFLGSLPFVDREKIGAIGICGSGGFALTAAQVDPRIKAVATASMYDISSMVRDGFAYSLTDEAREQMKVQLAEQRWTDFANGYSAVPEGGWPTDGPAETLPEGLPEVMSEFFEYYGMERGWHPNTMPNFTLTSSLAFMNFPLMTHLEEISPRPILFIMGENAHSRYYTEEAYEKAAEPKELVVVPEARHIDLYDGGDKDYIPFEKIDTFFKENLK